jgi:hypothetical protein
MTRAILYQSTAQTEFPSIEDHNILESAWRHNGQMGVTGYLLRSHTQYFQYLEGAGDVLEDLLDMIQKDPRHMDLRILSDTTLSERRFAKWGMGYHFLSESERDEFDGWLKEDAAFAKSMIDYMEQMAQRREAR